MGSVDALTRQRATEQMEESTDYSMHHLRGRYEPEIMELWHRCASALHPKKATEAWEMTEEPKRKPRPMQRYLDDVFEVMTQNQEFLLNNTKVLCEECVEFTNDAIDYVALVTRRQGSRELYLERSMVFFLNHVLMPFSYAIYPETLLGNVPGCFMQLRLVHESLVKCYVADACYPNGGLFYERLELVEKRGLSTNKLMKQLGRRLGLDNEFAALWNQLSREWVHTKGILDRVVDRLAEESDVPPWALAIPVNYKRNDLGALDYLYTQISRFRSLLAVTMAKYEQEIGF